VSRRKPSKLRPFLPVWDSAASLESSPMFMLVEPVVDTTLAALPHTYFGFVP